MNNVKFKYNDMISVNSLKLLARLLCQQLFFQGVIVKLLFIKCNNVI